jgi:hypothetical protein
MLIQKVKNIARSIYSLLAKTSGAVIRLLRLLITVGWLTIRYSPYYASGVITLVGLQYYGAINVRELVADNRYVRHLAEFRDFKAAKYLAVFKEAKVPTRYSYSQEEVEKINREAAGRYGVPEELSLAFADVESAGDPTATRFEAAYVDHGICRQYRNTEKKRNCASSFGAYQVMYSIWHRECELNSFADLYDPRINAACGNYILSQLLERTRGIKDLDQRLHAIAKAYNGPRMRPEYLESLKDAMAQRMFAQIIDTERRKELIREIDAPRPIRLTMR